MTKADDIARYPVITDNCVTCGRLARGQGDCLNFSGQLEHLDCHAWHNSIFYFNNGLEFVPVLARDLGRLKESLERLVGLWRHAEKSWPRDAAAIVRNSWARKKAIRQEMRRRKLIQALRNF